MLVFQLVNPCDRLHITSKFSFILYIRDEKRQDLGAPSSPLHSLPAVYQRKIEVNKAEVRLAVELKVKTEARCWATFRVSSPRCCWRQKE